MPVGDVAANSARRTAHTFEPRACIVRDIFKLPTIDPANSSRCEDQCSEYEQQRVQSHHEPPHTDEFEDGLMPGWRPYSNSKMLSQRNIGHRRTTLVNTIDRDDH